MQVLLGRLTDLTVLRLDYAAVKSGSIVVPCCGLDSVPSDILAFVANKTLKCFGGPSTTIDLSTSAWKLGGASISGGTFSTILTALEEVPRHKLRIAGHDFSLSPGLSCRIISKSALMTDLNSFYQLKEPPSLAHVCFMPCRTLIDPFKEHGILWQ